MVEREGDEQLARVILEGKMKEDQGLESVDECWTVVKLERKLEEEEGCSKGVHGREGLDGTGICVKSYFDNMDDHVADSNTSIDDSFRSFKRRKFFRKRVESGSDAEEDTSTKGHVVIDDTPRQSLPPSGDGREQTDVEAQVSVAELLRRRRAVHKKRAGIEFSNSTPAGDSSGTIMPGTGDEILDNEESLNRILTVVDRFAPQTGQVGDVDKHMMAYIDSELAKRRQGQEPSAPKIDSGDSDEDFDEDSLEDTPADLARHRQPAALGKLHEIDLGQDATLRNIARTEAARKRLETGEAEIEVSTGKIRRRRDGKPWRGRKRRPSVDVKRDKLVEEIMKESRRATHYLQLHASKLTFLTVEIYDEPDAEAPNDDQAADERIAEQFRKDFMDAISSRRQKARQSAKKRSGQKVDDKPRGPKLGGSRSARAAMREQQEKAAKK
ncbi:MAG: hypothetical protein Q9212_007305 [Teloschistes hypoglaucus]